MNERPRERLDYTKSEFFGYAGNAATEPLSWDIRLKIAIGAAKGLAFLHTSEKQVIYRDFKASNILLDGVRFFANMFLAAEVYLLLLWVL